ncbi:MAG TPA: hypothetical protein VKA94_15400 [Hyphomicrobiales bacterium]|nr:hypothetical protein [Hyphomicrobiales bacterium]
MAAFLKAVASIVTILGLLAEFISGWLKSREVREAAEAYINEEEAQNARDASSVYAERRDRDDLVDRLRDGTF